MTFLISAIPLLLLGGASVLGFLALSKARGAKVPDRLVSMIACAFPAAAFLCTFFVFLNLDGRRLVAGSGEWIQVGDLAIGLKLAVDNLTCVMLLVVTGIGTLIHVYSTGYMKGDSGYARYFCYLNLFMFFMLVLVLGENLLILFVGWEGVGLCSYLLIGFWWQDLEKANAGMKAFLVNRIGDAGFMLGMILIYRTAGTLSFQGLRDFVHAHPGAFLEGAGFFGVTIATASCLLLFLGATGKSAQIPLYVWLPDAMAGPTPVSALIHAATMVTAGVYMVGRMNFLFDLSQTAQVLVSLIGALTAFFAATIALTQNDIKKVLAYSTVSQLGYMFIAVGLGAVSAAVFHLVTHAFFKACLFLGSGSVIHAMGGEQDMRKMGGLAKKMPITFATMAIASVAMAGIPPLAGFFSKDEILWKAFSTPLGTGRFLWLLGLLAAVCTAFYMGRLIFMTFTGSCRADEHTKHHLHESPASMTGVLCVLAAGAVLVGFLGVPHFLGGHDVFGHYVDHAVALDAPHAGEGHGRLAAEFALAVVSVMIAVAGIFAAYVCYVKDPHIPAQVAKKHADVYDLVSDKYRVDEAYQAAVVRPLETFAQKTLYGLIDRRWIDKTIDRLAAAFRWFGERLAWCQTGEVRQYVAVMIGGLLLIMLSLLT
jgi:NADH-quinone oxidoreductase subunit L